MFDMPRGRRRNTPKEPGWDPNEYVKELQEAGVKFLVQIPDRVFRVLPPGVIRFIDSRVESNCLKIGGYVFVLLSYKHDAEGLSQGLSHDDYEHKVYLFE